MALAVDSIKPQNEEFPSQQKDDKVVLPRNPHRVIRVSFIFLACTLGAFLIWAAFAPLKQGAAAGGVVTVATYKKVIQHQYGGTVKEILVHEGDEVHQGQPLIRLEDSDIKAKFAGARAEYVASLVVYSRLQAERAFMPQIVYPEEVLQMKDDPEIKRMMMVQEALFKARRTKLEADKKVLMESLKGLREYASSLEKQRASYQKQLELLVKQVDSLKSLSDEGYYPKNRFLDLERAAEDLRAKMAETLANQLRAQSAVQEYMMRISAIDKEFLKEVETELADVEKKLPALKDNYNAVKDMLAKTEIKSPDDGIVMGLKVHTIGGVVMPGQPIMEIVPKNSELIIEAKLSPQHVEDVRKGLKADLHFVALDPKKTPVLEGEVIYVSPDLMMDEATKAPYYLLRVRIDEKSLQEIRKLNKEVIPGMPVHVIVQTSSRTFLSYLVKPFVDRLAMAFLK
jgi:HlyD family type I secretion membrane fusion protein